ncbi:MAG: hypothetical protein K2P14_10125 [Anaeroplasmataceae bacterium]|nr:hypothetical protein [Anaeroplasmataceae bacterium]
MKILDSNLFYPHFSKKFDYDLWKKKLQAAEMKYEEYLSNCKKDIDQELLKIYELTNHFHDYNFHKIIFHANKIFSCKDKVDIIEMRLFSKDANIISLYLKDIISFSMHMNQLNFKEQERIGLEDIVLCEIGYEKKCSFINLHMISGAEISIYFKNAKFKIKSLESLPVGI